MEDVRVSGRGKLGEVFGSLVSQGNFYPSDEWLDVVVHICSVGTKIINFVEKEEEKLSGWDTMVSLFNFSFLKQIDIGMQRICLISWTGNLIDLKDLSF